LNKSRDGAQRNDGMTVLWVYYFPAKALLEVPICNLKIAALIDIGVCKKLVGHWNIAQASGGH